MLGAIAGYFLGYYAYETLAKPILSFYGKLEAFEALKACTSEDTLVMLLVTSGLAHCRRSRWSPSWRAWHRSVLCFLSSPASSPGGARFFALAWALRRWGNPIRDFIEKRLGLLAGIVAAILIALYVAAKYFGGGGAMTC